MRHFFSRAFSAAALAGAISANAIADEDWIRYGGFAGGAGQPHAGGLYDKDGDVYTYGSRGISKWSRAGTLLWSRAFEGDWDAGLGTSAISDGQGNVWVVLQGQTAMGQLEQTLGQYDKNGNRIRWQKIDAGWGALFSPATATLLGNTSVGSGVSRRIVLRCYGLDGTVQWSADFGPKDHNTLKRTTVDPAGNIYILGKYSDEGFEESLFSAKFDQAGGHLWTNTFTSHKGVDSSFDQMHAGEKGLVSAVGLGEQNYWDWFNMFSPQDGVQVTSNAVPRAPSTYVSIEGLASSPDGAVFAVAMDTQHARWHLLRYGLSGGLTARIYEDEHRSYGAILTDPYGRVYVSRSSDDDGVAAIKIYRASDLQPLGQIPSYFAAAGTLTLDPRGYIYVSSFRNIQTGSEGVAAKHNIPAILTSDRFGFDQGEDTTVPAPGLFKNDVYIHDSKPTLVTPPQHGSVTFGEEGAFTYTPAAGYVGPDSFSYKVVRGTTTSNTVTVSIVVRGLTGLSVSPSTVQGGSGTTASFTYSAASGKALTFAVSSNSSVLVPPASVTLQIGATSGAFAVKTLAVSSTATRAISISKGGITKSASITLTPGGLGSLSLSAGSVTGGASVTGKVTLSAPAPAGGKVVTLSDNTSAITTPASATVSVGATTAQFQVSTSPVSTTVTRQVYATLDSVTKTANLTILRPELLSLTISPSTVKGGTSATGKVTLSGVSAGSTSVALTDNTSAVTTPSSVAVNAGSNTGAFAIGTSRVTATATRQVTASLNGVSRVANITITP